MASREGGMDIEEVAETNPDSIHKITSSGKSGFDRDSAWTWKQIGIDRPCAREIHRHSLKIGVYVHQSDCSMIEINPLVETSDQDIIALDAKVSFDENASFDTQSGMICATTGRGGDRAQSEENGSSYVKLDGDIGCMVNGAGLAMATMDVIKLYGGEPANFLDVGGGADENQVTTAFSIILEDPNVKGILVNIFGGIMRCDIIARE